MINTFQIYETLSHSLGEEAARALAAVLGQVYEDLQQTATRGDAADLRAALNGLAEGQRRGEQRTDRLDQALIELAEAQKRTEQRVEELAEAQKRTEQRVEELAEAQKRTEQRVEELAEAQKRTEQRVEELAEAQKRTEVLVSALAQRLDETNQRLDETNRQLGGLATTIGYTLENEAYRHLPALLARDHGLELSEPLDRDYVTDARGRDWEVNILGRGRIGEREVRVIGESKARLSQRDVDRFLDQRVAALREVVGEVFPVLVTHMTTGKEVREHARSRGVALYRSSEFGR